MFGDPQTAFGLIGLGLLCVAVLAAEFLAICPVRQPVLEDGEPLTSRDGWIVAERAIAIWLGSIANGRNPMFNGRWQRSRDGTSRMTRECQVRICERLGVKFPGPTRPTRKRSAAQVNSAYRGAADSMRSS
jgi:hypothetical protein